LKRRRREEEREWRENEHKKTQEEEDLKWPLEPGIITGPTSAGAAPLR